MDHCPWTLAMAGQTSICFGQSVPRLPSWHARPMVQKNLPPKTPKKTTLLVGKTGKDFTRCSCGMLYHRGGARTRPKDFFPLPGEGSGYWTGSQRTTSTNPRADG